MNPKTHTVSASLVSTNRDLDTKEVDSTSLFKRWGGFKDHPETNKCYKQERTAILLSIFLGSLGVDQFYAHHWPLAVCKLLFCLPAVVVRIVLWICALVEPDECRVVIPIFLLFGPWCAWTVTDVILWTVGGVYGTPGCAGTWKH